MRKTLLSALIAVGAVAAVGVARADMVTGYTYVTPGATTTYVAPAYVTPTYVAPIASSCVGLDCPIPSTTVLGAGPAVTTTYVNTYPAYSYSYLVPGRDTWTGYDNSAAETSNVPARAGEASTMTNGAPNLETNNYPW